MEDNICRKILMQSPLGFALCKILPGKEGRGLDYVFISVNPAFEKITGLKQENIIGEKVTEILPDIRSGNFNWIGFYGDIALSGEQREFTEYSESFTRWYKTTAFPMEKGYLITFIQDINDEV